jgi:hypothetical protein
VAGLGWTEVALLEVLGDWHQVIEIDEASARSVGQYPPLTVWRLELSGHDRAGK